MNDAKEKVTEPIVDASARHYLCESPTLQNVKVGVKVEIWTRNTQVSCVVAQRDFFKLGK